MPQLEIVAANGTGTGKTVDLSEKLFANTVNPLVVREVLTQYHANQRRGTASTKTRAMIRGGGAKPWRQKGTGRARHGTNTSPIWRHGGVTFGPLPRDFSYKIPKKKSRLAFYSVLTSKLEENKIRLVEKIDVSEPKTRAMAGFLTSLGLSDEKTLIILDKVERAVYLAGRNIPGVKVIVADNINIFDALYYDTIVFTPESLNRLEVLIG